MAGASGKVTDIIGVVLNAKFPAEGTPEIYNAIEIPLEDGKRLVAEVQLYQAILESIASEHSARMVAMRNATDNAKELTRDLTLSYNKTRQANITKEVSEIASGAAALAE